MRARTTSSTTRMVGNCLLDGSFSRPCAAFMIREQASSWWATGAADSSSDSGQGKQKGRMGHTQPKTGTDVNGAMKALHNASSESTGKPPPTVLVRMAVSDYLRECGYNVVETSDAREAIEVMTSDVIVDIAFSDIAMSGS